MLASVSKHTLYKAESLNDSTAHHHHLQPQEIKELKLKLTGRAKHSTACSTLFPPCHCLWIYEAWSPLIYRSAGSLQTDSLKAVWYCRLQNAELCDLSARMVTRNNLAAPGESSAQAKEWKLAAIQLLATLTMPSLLQLLGQHLTDTGQCRNCWSFIRVVWKGETNFSDPASCIKLSSHLKSTHIMVICLHLVPGEKLIKFLLVSRLIPPPILKRELQKDTFIFI